MEFTLNCERLQINTNVKKSKVMVNVEKNKGDTCNRKREGMLNLQ